MLHNIQILKMGAGAWFYAASLPASICIDVSLWAILSKYQFFLPASRLSQLLPSDLLLFEKMNGEQSAQFIRTCSHLEIGKLFTVERKSSQILPGRQKYLVDDE